MYPYIAVFLRGLLGWLPFSLGDILYGMFGLWLLFRLVKSIRLLVKKQRLPSAMIRGMQRVLVLMLLIYIIFNVLWGINYNRKGIASQLGLSMNEYSLEEVKLLNNILLQKVNESSAVLLQNPPKVKSSGEIFRSSMDAYGALNQQYSFINYHPASIKTSLWGWLGNYVGFMGYYNPFTGEGQVNTTIPKFLQPYTNCHEIAHQLGYAKENEANFVGYLAAAASKDPSFHYSVYLDLFLYANRNLYQTDSASAKTFTKQLQPSVKQDLKDWWRFNNRHKNPVEPVIRWIYGKYLESNQQPSGVLSYDEVTGFLIAYYKKFGRL
ncbi:MAG: hypothetical protein JWP81_4272 [Ferruginibacter sp.]|nr:hypothetical protein [Ferruginibacter sp.]